MSNTAYIVVLNMYYSLSLHFTLGGIYYYYSHFTDEDNEAQRSYATCPSWKNGIQAACFEPSP